MPRTLAVFLAGLLAATAAGCGSSASKTSGTGTTTSATVPASAPPAVRAIAGRLLIAGDLRGFSPQGRRTISTSAESWVHDYPASEQEKEKRRLEGLGFVRGVSEKLATATNNGAEAVANAIQFRSPHAAATNVVVEATKPAFGGKTFAVARIPGARGFGGNFGSFTGYNVAFAVGPYYYLVGEGFPTGMSGAPTREELVTAAQRLYARVRG
jgi:hypothetical protein